MTTAELSHDELACIYACAILADDNVKITGENISKVIKAANVSVEFFWPELFANALATLNANDVQNLFTVSVSGLGGSSSPVAAVKQTPDDSDTKGKADSGKVVAAKQSDSDSSDDDLNLGLFD